MAFGVYQKWLRRGCELSSLNSDHASSMLEHCRFGMQVKLLGSKSIESILIGWAQHPTILTTIIMTNPDAMEYIQPDFGMNASPIVVQVQLSAVGDLARGSVVESNEQDPRGPMWVPLTVLSGPA
ncbi:hypothetical protein ACFX2A_017322 [Malus domestica]